MNAKALGLLVVLGVSALGSAQDEVTASAEEVLFIDAAAQTDIYEIAAARLAVGQAESPEVVAFAEAAIDAHTRTTVELLPLADDLGVTPTSDGSPADGVLLSELRGLTGSEFDAAYLEQQVRTHEGAVTVYTLSQDAVSDPALAAFIERTLPVLQEQLAEARALAGSLD